MRIGIHPNLKRHDGGIYQYAVSLMDALFDLSREGHPLCEYEFVIFAHDPNDELLLKYADGGWTIRSFRPPWAPTPTIDFDFDCATNSVAPIQQTDMRDWILECGVKLMIYPSPHRLSFECGVPFIMSIHDLQHLHHPEFPEVSAGGEFRRREYVLRNVASKAILLIAESEVGKEDIIRAFSRFGITRPRVKVLPYSPPRSVGQSTAQSLTAQVRKKFMLPDRFLFYPAQFWPHKNHLRIIEALGLLKKRHGLEIPLILTGSASGAIRTEVESKIQKRCGVLHLNEQVRHLGYVSDEEIAGLYAGATALIMPTFFGPTNIPFLEAWSLDCPVLTSRIRGILEQVGDAAMTVNPESDEEIAIGIQKLWSDNALRQTLIKNGRRKLAEYTPDDFRNRLSEIIESAATHLATNSRGFASQLNVGVQT
ncbi:MAG: glycosyltransferase family 4 protein [Planctomycetes bacterium]|nr:glycosyltransferase family 4 protein [Planctomycetota bacterium]